MPGEIPTDPINDVAPQVQPGAGFTPNVSPNDFGAGIGQAMEGMAGEMRHVAMYEKRYHDSERASSLADDTGLKAHGLLNDPKTGLLAQNPQDPADPHRLADQARDQWRTYRDHALDGVENEHQRALVTRSLMHLDQYVNDQINRWELGTSKQISGKLMQKGIQVDILNATKGAPSWNPGQIDWSGQGPAMQPAGPAPDPSAAAAASITARIDTYAKQYGVGPDDAEAMKAQAMNQLHGGVLRSLLAPGGDANRAKAYYDQHQGDLFPQERDTLGKAVDGEVLHQQSGAIAHEMLYDEKTGRPRDEADVLDDMAKDKRLMGNDRLAGAVEAEVGRQFRLQKAAKTERQGQLFDYMDRDLDKVGGDVHEFPSDAFWSLSKEQRDALERRGKQIQDGKLTPDNSDTYYGLRRMAASDPEAFKAKDLRSYRADLSGKDYGEIINLQAEAMGKKPPAGAGKGIDVVSTKEQIMKPVLKGMGTDDQNEFQRTVDRAVAAAGGMEKVGTGGLQKIVDELTIQQAAQSPRGWYNPARWFGDATTEEPQARWRALPKGYAFGIDQVPPEAREAQRQKAMARGIPHPTDDDIVGGYNAGLSHGGP